MRLAHHRHVTRATSCAFVVTFHGSLRWKIIVIILVSVHDINAPTLITTMGEIEVSDIICKTQEG